MKTILTIIILLIVAYAAIIAWSRHRVAPDLAKLAANGAIILDVRTEKEFTGGHIPGAVNISLGLIREDYRLLDSSKTYITCCSHGLRSVKVVDILKERSFKHVYNGGAWTDLYSKLQQ
jgi:rhodanese-related sulfurtransferase